MSAAASAAEVRGGVGAETVGIPDRRHRAPEGPYRLLGQCIRPLLTAADTDGQYSLFEVTVAPGTGVPPHVHAWEDESWFVLEGRLTLTLAGQTREVGPGEVAFGPRSVEHGFVNAGAEPVRLVLTCTPGGFEHFFAECHGVCARTTEMGPVLECVRRNGMTMRG